MFKAKNKFTNLLVSNIALVFVAIFTGLIVSCVAQIFMYSGKKVFELLNISFLLLSTTIDIKDDCITSIKKLFKC